MILIIQRHAERLKNTGEASGDGPLTTSGRAQAEMQAQLMEIQLKRRFVTQIDYAIVSGSIRCAETFAETWRHLLTAGIRISDYTMAKEYFSTVEEDKSWAKLFVPPQYEKFMTAQKAVGERQATLDFAGTLVEACVKRTVNAIKSAVMESRKQVILVVTHEPHAALIVERFTGTDQQILELGHFAVIDVPYTYT